MPNEFSKAENEFHWTFIFLLFNFRTKESTNSTELDENLWKYSKNFLSKSLNNRKNYVILNTTTRNPLEEEKKCFLITSHSTNKKIKKTFFNCMKSDAIKIKIFIVNSNFIKFPQLLFLCESDIWKCFVGWFWTEQSHNPINNGFMIVARYHKYLNGPRVH